MTIPKSTIDELRRECDVRLALCEPEPLIPVDCVVMIHLLDAAERCNRLEAVLRTIKPQVLCISRIGESGRITINEVLRQIDEALKKQP